LSQITIIFGVIIFHSELSQIPSIVRVIISKIAFKQYFVGFAADHCETLFCRQKSTVRYHVFYSHCLV